MSNIQVGIRICSGSILGREHMCVIMSLSVVDMFMSRGRSDLEIGNIGNEFVSRCVPSLI